MKFRRSDLCAGRVVSEDEDFILLEIPKSNQKEVSVQDGDRWYVLAFITAEPEPHVWKPWEDESDDLA